MIRWMSNLTYEQLKAVNLFVIILLFTGFFVSTFLNPIILFYYKLVNYVTTVWVNKWWDLDFSNALISIECSQLFSFFSDEFNS